MQGAGFRVHGAGCRVQGSGMTVQGAGFRVPDANLNPARTNETLSVLVLALGIPLQALRTSIKSQFWKILKSFGDKCPQKGSKNESMAQRTSLG